MYHLKDPRVKDVYWTHPEKMCSAMASGGNLDGLKLARDNGCSWDEETCYNAAEGGHLHVLQWARDNGCSWGCRYVF